MSFPDVSDAFWGFTVPSTLRVVTKSPTDFEAVELPGTGQVFDGILQPMPPQRLLIKSEGQRTWKWWTLWTTRRLELDDVVVDADIRTFRVMRVSDWREGGHLEYELAEAVPVP